MRLNDIYYTDEYLDGNPGTLGPQRPVQYFQGDTISFELLLNHDEQPVLPDRWQIFAVVKPDAYALNPIWTGEYSTGIFDYKRVGEYQVIIPAEITSQWFAGTYWLDVRITEKESQARGNQPISVSIVRQPFSVDYSASSPNPANALKGITFVENTLPNPTRTNQF